ncbi:MAG: CBS domain-containing protein [Gammaproteobacteria bacterium]
MTTRQSPSVTETAEPKMPDSPSPCPVDTRRPPLVDIIDAIYEGKEVFLHYVRTVQDLMSAAEYLTLDHRIEDALRFLKKHSCRHILVVDLEEPDKGVKAPPKADLIGIVSQHDLARALSRGVGTFVETDEDQKTLKQPIDALVTRNPHTVREDTPLAEAIELMVHKKIDCLPVIREPRTPVGILTTTDVIKCFVRFFE